MNTVLDLRTIQLPSGLLVDGRDLAPQLLTFIDSTVTDWTKAGRLSRKEGYGFATTNVLPAGTLKGVNWDDPRALLGFGIAAHGADVRYTWNAVRKGRMLLRGIQAGYSVGSSLQLASEMPSDFARDPITDEEMGIERDGGPLRWGDFPYGGSVYRSDGVNEVMLGFSVWTQQEDDQVSTATADHLLELAAA